MPNLLNHLGAPSCSRLGSHWDRRLPSIRGSMCNMVADFMKCHALIYAMPAGRPTAPALTPSAWHDDCTRGGGTWSLFSPGFSSLSLPRALGFRSTCRGPLSIMEVPGGRRRNREEYLAPYVCRGPPPMGSVLTRTDL